MKIQITEMTALAVLSVAALVSTNNYGVRTEAIRERAGRRRAAGRCDDRQLNLAVRRQQKGFQRSTN